MSFLTELNACFDHEIFGPKHSALKSNRAFSGSTRHFMSERVGDAFAELRPSIGDFDVLVPKSAEKHLEQVLAGSDIADFEIFAKIKNGEVYSFLLHRRTFGYIQVDFCMVDYIDSVGPLGWRPSEFARWSHSAPMIDLKQGFRGVIHKLAVTSLVGMDRRSVKVYHNGRVNQEEVEWMSFSVSTGIRRKYEQYMGAYRHVRKARDMPCTANIEAIFYRIFGFYPTLDDKKKFNSFVGICDLVNGLEFVQKQLFVEGLIYRLYGPDKSKARRLGKTLEEDIAIKDPVVDYLMTQFWIPSEFFKARAAYLEERFSDDESGILSGQVQRPYKRAS